MIRSFLLSDKNIERDSYIWNMIGSMLNAFQSVIMLMILTRILGLVEAGIFTIAYANANLFLNIGKYGMRYFQVSDVNKQFTFQEYLSSRIISCLLMIVVSVLYTIYSAYSGSYTLNKTLIIIWMCLFKVVDAIEDVYHGMYQAQGRLDVASKIMSLRMLVTIILFSACLFVFKNQLIALIISTIITTILAFVFIKMTYSSFNITSNELSKNKVLLLLRLCFPLFAGAFLSFYIGNAPKYAIDSMLSDELQACYGFIAMPVFVIGLLNSFIFNPMLQRISLLWKDRKVKRFVEEVLIQVGIIFVITIICIIGAYLVGVPVLSWLYNTDLSPYKNELLILLLGGGFLGLSGLLNAVITIIRCQKSLMFGYLIISALALLFSNSIVGTYGITGASVLYVVLMVGLCLIFGLILSIGIYKNRALN